MYELKFEQMEDINGGHPVIIGIGLVAAAITIVDFSIGVYEGFTEK
ncbi:class IIb bacteriocin, lactobin A/cerein 7B family [Rheinheimera pleomorphica]|nr:class IIb bacteriocin, lactobin A/cerein 7B family [Rheinheimera pleomorphica]